MVHTSDTHLGDDLSHPKSNDALRKVVTETILLDANFLLLAGDVFDHSRVSDNAILLFLHQSSKYKKSGTMKWVRQSPLRSRE